MCDCDGFHSLFHETREPTARREHRCGECKGLIPKGTKHFYHVGKTEEYGGSTYFWDFRICSICDKDWSELAGIVLRETGYSCICFGKLAEEIHEAFDNGFLDEDHRLVRRWFPEGIVADLDNLDVRAQMAEIARCQLQLPVTV